jgi:hypothetical protein
MSDWKLVRETTSSSIWHPAIDNLAGTDVYTYPDAWSVPFESVVPGYDQFLFASVDMTKWMVATRNEIAISGYAN